MMKLQNSDKQLIENIAHQCPYKGGTAVYEARAIVWSYNPGVIFNEEDYCNDGGYFREVQAHNIVSNNITLVPNPAKGVTALYYSLADYNNITLSIIDATGREIQKDLLDSKQSNYILDLSNTDNGLYWLQIRTSEILIKSLKLCIIK